MFELFINGKSYGAFVLWSEALREAEYLVNESGLDPETIAKIEVVPAYKTLEN